MSPHDCIQDERIRDLQKRVDKLEVQSDNTREILKKLEDFQTRVTWGLIGLFCTSVGTLVSVVITSVVRK
jgi:hypothetical protein